MAATRTAEAAVAIQAALKRLRSHITLGGVESSCDDETHDEDTKLHIQQNQ